MSEMTPPEEFEAFRAAHREITAADEPEYYRLLDANDEYVGHLQYRGNSVSWIKSKADNYGRGLLDVWEALIECGIRPDGQTSAADAIRKFTKQKAATP